MIEDLVDDAAAVLDLTAGEDAELDDLDDPRFFDRELSWLAFNARVLQEAASPEVPMGERLLFLSIFSSNLDEFFRVRVASIRSLLLIKKKKRKKLHLRPKALLKAITKEVTRQQERFGRIFREELVPALADRGIRLIDDVQASERQRAFLESYFDEHLAARMSPVELGGPGDPPFLEDHAVYLAVELLPAEASAVAPPDPRIAFVRVPSPPLARFVSVPSDSDEEHVLFTDDVIRHNLPRLFPNDRVLGAWAIKLSRDADLYLEEELGASLREMIRKSLKKRDRGVPVRLLFDLGAPRDFVERLRDGLGLAEEDLIDGGRYHNLNDLAAFPLPDDPVLWNHRLPPLPHPELEAASSILEAAEEKDRLLRFPYQSFDYVVRFIREAGDDQTVEEIWISLYRVAKDSAVVQALIDAARKGKRVTAFVEVQARFDEQSNLEWAERMEEAGVRTLYGAVGLKVHAKIALVRRRRGSASQDIAYLATGNFNERTARIYADHGLFTADPRLTAEVHRVFEILSGKDVEPDFEHLVVAPFHLRATFDAKLGRERLAALSGEPCGFTAKMNSLQDHRFIERVYGAVQAGVPVRMIVRGICCARPGLAGVAEGLEVRSIVDRFLEHSRIYRFHAGGEDELYLASADLMSRNLNRRIEVAFPIYDEDIHRALVDELVGQLSDNTKARIIDEEQRNDFVPRSEPEVRAQHVLYERARSLLSKAAT